MGFLKSEQDTGKGGTRCGGKTCGSTACHDIAAPCGGEGNHAFTGSGTHLNAGSFVSEGDAAEIGHHSGGENGKDTAEPAEGDQSAEECDGCRNSASSALGIIAKENRCSHSEQECAEKEKGKQLRIFPNHAVQV